MQIIAKISEICQKPCNVKNLLLTLSEWVQIQVPSWLKSAKPIHQFLNKKIDKSLLKNTTEFLMPVKSASRPATPVRNSICSRLWGSARYPPACFKKSLASGNMLRLNDLLTHRFSFSISISPVRKQYLRQSRWTWSPLQGRCLLSKLGMKNNLHGGHSPIPQDTLPLPLWIKETIIHVSKNIKFSYQ